MTAWILLFLLQSLLIAGGHVQLHRRLGLFGAALASLVVLLGLAATLMAAARSLPPWQSTRCVRVAFTPLFLSGAAIANGSLYLAYFASATDIWRTLASRLVVNI